MTELPIPQTTSAQAFVERLDDAKRKATTLAEIVEQAKLYSVIQGHKYLNVEAWQIIGAGYGLTARIDRCAELPEGGWEARAEIITATGDVVGAAESEAGTAGDRPWTERPRYQQRSMAQTRAISKAFRSVLSWVVVLAGFEPTPADELPDANAEQPRGITDKQRRRMFWIAESNGVPRETIRTYLLHAFGNESTANLTREQYDDVCAWLEDPHRQIPLPKDSA